SAINSGVASAVRNNAGISFGGIHTGEAGTTRRFVGDLAEVRFYNTALTPTEVTNVMRELSDAHINVNLPLVQSFTASTNRIYLGQSATLSWNVTTNVTAINIDNGVGPVAVPGGSVLVNPTTTTTYTLLASNSFGARSATVTLIVDPGIPVASSLSTNTPQNIPVSFTVSASDPNGGALTWSIVTPPANGAL